MTTETDQPIDPESNLQEAGQAPSEDGVSSDAGDNGDSPDVEVPEYQEFENGTASQQPGDIARIQNIQITVSAELGRTTIPIHDLVGLSEGAVMELNREIDSPVELVAQGVPLAAGEVVVVDGCFAIRVTQVYENN